MELNAIICKSAVLGIKKQFLQRQCVPDIISGKLVEHH